MEAAGLDVAYEVDFWGRDRNAAFSAGAQREASEADYRAARMGVIAQTVATYLEIVDLRRQRGFAGETVDIVGEWATLASIATTGASGTFGMSMRFGAVSRMSRRRCPA